MKYKHGVCSEVLWFYLFTKLGILTPYCKAGHASSLQKKMSLAVKYFGICWHIDEVPCVLPEA